MIYIQYRQPPTCASEFIPYTTDANTTSSSKPSLAMNQAMTYFTLLGSRSWRRPGGARTAELRSRKRAERNWGGILNERNTRNPQVALDSEAVASFRKANSRYNSGLHAIDDVSHRVLSSTLLPPRLKENSLARQPQAYNDLRRQQQQIGDLISEILVGRLVGLEMLV